MFQQVVETIGIKSTFNVLGNAVVITEVHQVTKPPMTEESILKQVDWENQPLLAKRVRDGKVYEYRLGDDHFVYQFIDGINNGWLSSHTAWISTLHLAFNEDELIEEVG